MKTRSQILSEEIAKVVGDETLTIHDLTKSQREEAINNAMKEYALQVSKECRVQAYATASNFQRIIDSINNEL